jgi:hypothetical protein
MIVLCFGLSSVEADTLITAKEGSSQAGSPLDSGIDLAQTKQIWLRADRMANIGDGSRMIGRLDRGETYLINDVKKTCFRIKHQKYQEYQRWLRVPQDQRDTTGGILGSSGLRG